MYGKFLLGKEEFLITEKVIQHEKIMYARIRIQVHNFITNRNSQIYTKFNMHILQKEYA